MSGIAVEAVTLGTAVHSENRIIALSRCDLIAGELMSVARETVLVVDDEEMVRRLATRILVSQGYLAVEARGGDEAVRMLQRNSHRVDGVLTDLAMPGIDGRTLGETVARCWPQIRVLYMSGFPASRMVSEGALDPSKPFVQKPFTSEQLLRKMREIFTVPIRQ